MGSWDNPQLTKEFRRKLKGTELQIRRADWPGPQPGVSKERERERERERDRARKRKRDRAI